MSHIWILCLSLSCCLQPVFASHSTLETSIRQEIEPYLIAETNPAKKILDEIVATCSTNVFYDMKSMCAAGFDFAEPQHKTGIIVTRHPKLPGIIIKAYLDVQEYYEGKPEYYYWIKRVQGANLIREAIKKYNYEHLLKVPRKWIYELPNNTYTVFPTKRKRFILVEDDMDILDDKENKARWGSPFATKELLLALHTIITEFRFKDCAKPANCPFSKDGRVALVDTQSFYKRSVGYYKLTPYLTPEMQKYWKSLPHIGVKGH